MIEIMILSSLSVISSAVRVGCAIWCLPVTGEFFTSNKVKFSLAFFLTLTATPFGDVNSDMNLNYIYREAVVGCLYGMSIRICVQLMHISGEIVSNMISLSYSIPNISGGNSTVISNIFTLTATFLICLHSAPSVFLKNVLMIDISRFELNSIYHIMLQAIDIFVRAVLLSVSLVSHFIIFALIFNIGMGFLSKLSPSLPIVVILSPATLIVGLLYLAIAHASILDVWVLFLLSLAYG